MTRALFFVITNFSLYIFLIQPTSRHHVKNCFSARPTSFYQVSSELINDYDDRLPSLSIRKPSTISPFDLQNLSSHDDHDKRKKTFDCKFFSTKVKREFHLKCKK